MMNKVRIYSIENCPYCKELKDRLINLSIPFDDINVDLKEHENEYEKIAKITKSDQVPITKVGKRLLVPNISFKSIEECSLLIKKLLEESE